jgi:hypothetical protein
MARLTKKARRAAALKGWRSRKRNSGFSLRRRLDEQKRKAQGWVYRKTHPRGKRRNPPSGWIPAKAVKLVRKKNGAVEVRIKR